MIILIMTLSVTQCKPGNKWQDILENIYISISIYLSIYIYIYNNVHLSCAHLQPDQSMVTNSGFNGHKLWI